MKRPRRAAFHLLVIVRYSGFLVWRRIRVPDTMTLATLHRVLVRAFDWHGGMPYQFKIARRLYEPPQNFGLRGTGIDTASVTIGEVAKRRSQLLYLYDWFGECWEHDIIVEDVDRDPRHEPWEDPLLLDGDNMVPTPHHLAEGATFELEEVGAMLLEELAEYAPDPFYDAPGYLTAPIEGTN